MITMSEKQEKKKEKKEPNIYWIDGIPCLELPKGSVIFKRKIKQQNPYNHPYTFGWLQEEKKRKFMPDILDELKHLFNVPFFPANWRIL